MEEKTLEIALVDGTRLSVAQNGNCYIFDGVINDEQLRDENLTTVTINGEQYSDLTCCNKWMDGSQTWFIFREYTETEKLIRDLRSENQSLQNDNEMLKGCVMELADVVFGGDEE